MKLFIAFHHDGQDSQPLIGVASTRDGALKLIREYDTLEDHIDARWINHIWDIPEEEEEKKGFKYTRTSRYFIRKQDSDKSWISDLAGYCELIKNGEDQDDVKYVDKVF